MSINKTSTISMKEELSFQLRETLFLLSTNMADVTPAENQQFPAIVTLFDLKLKQRRKIWGAYPGAWEEHEKSWNFALQPHLCCCYLYSKLGWFNPILSGLWRYCLCSKNSTLRAVGTKSSWPFSSYLLTNSKCDNSFHTLVACVIW